MRADNEANLAALAEHWQGVARDLDDFICVFGEVGVGGGIFVDGELFRGAHGYGGEFGHVTVDPDGPPCNCGAAGCLETLAARRRSRAAQGSASARAGATRSLTRDSSSGRRRATQPCSRASPRPAATSASALASAVNLFDVDAVVLGGASDRSSPWLADDVRRMLDERVLSAAWSGCEIRASEFGEGAAVRGAAALTLRSILAEPWLVAERVRPPSRERVSLTMSYQQRPSFRRGGERQAGRRRNDRGRRCRSRPNSSRSTRRRQQ